MQWTFCNTTAETQKISEIPLWEHSDVNFHQLAILISAASGLAACTLSFFLMWMHALHYTKPAEQRNIIRILLMIPIYSASNFLQLYYYHHSVYYAVISDCYEAFAISAFFSLMCTYISPTLHDQKKFFRQLSPIQPWVLPVNWFKAMCGGDRGPWRTPKSGLTWFNIIWIGVYHYCFIRVTMTIVAVVTQHYDRYCSSSLSPYFAHVWVLAIECVAVAIAMYCVIQFYVQFKQDMAYHKPGIKVVAIKGVIFLSFWQSTAISVASSWLNIIPSSSKLQYPDIAIGIPALMLSVEMFLFAIVHIFAYPWAPYRRGAPVVFYPKPSEDAPEPKENAPLPPSGGKMGFRAIGDAFNFWDVVKAFGRGMRWLFVGVKRRHEDVSYQKGLGGDIDMDGKDAGASHALYPFRPRMGKSTDHLPIAGEFRRSTFGMNQHLGNRVPLGSAPEERNEEGAGLIAHAQDNPSSRATSPFREYEAEPYESDLGYRGAVSRFEQHTAYEPQTLGYQEHRIGQPVTHPHKQLPGHAVSTNNYYEQRPEVNMSVYSGRDDASVYPDDDGAAAAGPSTGPSAAAGGQQLGAGRARDSTQMKIGAALWGQNPHQHPDGPMI